MPIHIAYGGQANTVEILGQPLWQRLAQRVEHSDFTIRSTKQPQCRHLVLPCTSGNRYAAWRYTTAPWGTENAAPAVCDEAMASRRLPFDGAPQPWIAASDLLEPVLLRSPHLLNKKWVADGDSDDTDAAYLLPVKPLLFEYFTAADIAQMVTLRRLAGSNIAVTLRVPAAKGEVEFRRIYTPCAADESRNEGHVTEAQALNAPQTVPATPATKPSPHIIYFPLAKRTFFLTAAATPSATRATTTAAASVARHADNTSWGMPRVTTTASTTASPRSASRPTTRYRHAGSQEKRGTDNFNSPKVVRSALFA